MPDSVEQAVDRICITRINREGEKHEEQSDKRLAWTDVEVHKFIKSMPKENGMYKIAFLLMLVTGARIGEILGLTYDNIVPQESKVVIEK